MFKSTTTFVIGAGASFEAGLPTGNILRQNIADKLNIKFDEFKKKQTTGSRLIVAALQRGVQKQDGGQGNINPFLHKARRMRDALRQEKSIDNYLDAQEDEEVSYIAKLAIAEIILVGENNSQLKVIKNSRHQETIDFPRLESTWFHSFFQRLIEGARKARLVHIFDNINFISFNYDRTLEHFLYYSLQNTFGIGASEAADLVKTLTVLHPYGTLGELEWQTNNSASVKFGQNEHIKLELAAQNIRTFTEQMSNSDEIKQIHELISQSDQLCFLGFAFHDPNIDLLNPEASLNATRILSTAKGISDSDCSVIRNTLGTLGRRSVQGKPRNSENNYGLQNFEVRNNLTCCDFFHEFNRLLRA